jgi:hypothetical protein
MSRLNKLISKTLKEFKVKKKVEESNFEFETDEDGWDIVNYYSSSEDDDKERDRISKLNKRN